MQRALRFRGDWSVIWASLRNGPRPGCQCILGADDRRIQARCPRCGQDQATERRNACPGERTMEPLQLIAFLALAVNATTLVFAQDSKKSGTASSKQEA